MEVTPVPPGVPPAYGCGRKVGGKGHHSDPLPAYQRWAAGRVALKAQFFLWLLNIKHPLPFQDTHKFHLSPPPPFLASLTTIFLGFLHSLPQGMVPLGLSWPHIRPCFFPPDTCQASPTHLVPRFSHIPLGSQLPFSPRQAVSYFQTSSEPLGSDPPPRP